MNVPRITSRLGVALTSLTLAGVALAGVGAAAEAGVLQAAQNSPRVAASQTLNTAPVADVVDTAQYGSTALATPAPGAWPTVKQGQHGTNVTTVQYLLVARGYHLTVDGAFGPATADAVKAFQRAHHLTADGIAGPQTWSVLPSTLKAGARGAAVKALQVQLARHQSLAVDGAFGPATAGAVKAFQRAHHLTTDGIAGPRTWNALLTSPGASKPPTQPPAVPSSKLRSAIVSQARSQLHVAEAGGGCNKYLPGGKSCRSTAWCAAFAEWTWRHAGVRNVPTTLGEAVPIGPGPRACPQGPMSRCATPCSAGVEGGSAARGNRVRNPWASQGGKAVTRSP
ncbi:peptidoglycan-binding protein [Streptomyces sp. NPDC006333]|uniref:peptidoglycan-binding domain-containing protein n=1 Tax=Streptomyces sp. NPDC006333 TaxID=3156753 RepID=UPI0033A05CE4